MEVYNGTPHELVLVDPRDRKTIVARIPPSRVIRAREESLATDRIVVEETTFPVVIKTYGKPEGLPQRQNDRIIVVSAIAYQAIKENYPERAGPDGDVRMTNDRVRDRNGQIIGFCTFAC